MDFLKEKIKVSLREINKYRKEWSAPVKGFKYFDCEPKTNNVLPSPEDPRFKDFLGEVWDIGPDSHQWFYKRIVIPDGAKGKKIRFQLQTGTSGWNVNNPQFIAYIDGKMVQGLDINHTSLPVGSKTEFDLHLYAYSGAQPKNLRFCPSVYVTNELCEKVYYDITVPYELLDCLSPISKEYADIIEHLDRALNKIDFRQAPGGNFVRSLEAASEYMDTEFYGKYCDIKQDRSVVAFGHTHIDCAWKWTFAQSREKVQRSFSNVMTNMAEYPDYKFMQSQPLLYRYAKEEAPELYEQIKEKVKEGRWECEGAMYVEADCNLPSGESFVRQLIYGKGFFRREFGKESEVFWVPDVFGYSAALPQILKKSGVDYFVTSKLSWNEKNRYPYDIFRWRGIDGTEVNGYFLTSQEKERSEEYRNRTNYNAKMSPRYAVGTFDRLQQKTLTDEVLLPFGYGDGGGGPTREHLEHMKRLSKGIRCCP
ncbi:MAG: alpha-mannosidase, partial [Eubacteriales bacterium]